MINEPRGRSRLPLLSATSPGGRFGGKTEEKKKLGSVRELGRKARWATGRGTGGGRSGCAVNGRQTSPNWHLTFFSGVEPAFQTLCRRPCAEKCLMQIRLYSVEHHNGRERRRLGPEV